MTGKLFLEGIKVANESVRQLSYALANLHDLQFTRENEIINWWGEDGLDPMKKGLGGI
jgi:hypothetical protein